MAVDACSVMAVGARVAVAVAAGLDATVAARFVIVLVGCLSGELGDQLGALAWQACRDERDTERFELGGSVAADLDSGSSVVALSSYDQGDTRTRAHSCDGRWILGAGGDDDDGGLQVHTVRSGAIGERRRCAGTVEGGADRVSNGARARRRCLDVDRHQTLRGGDIGDADRQDVGVGEVVAVAQLRARRIGGSHRRALRRP